MTLCGTKGNFLPKNYKMREWIRVAVRYDGMIHGFALRGFFFDRGMIP
jgi:hypothetical protein